jgi:hypothetical protein
MTGERRYPRFECERWAGRLETPRAFRGTVIARDFESGRIGGRKLVSSASFADDEDGRKGVLEWARQHRDGDIEIVWIRDPRSHRRGVRVQEVFAKDFVERGLHAVGH